MHASVRVCMCVCVRVCMVVRTYMCIYVCMNVCVCMYVVLYVRTYVCMFAVHVQECVHMCMICLYMYGGCLSFLEQRFISSRYRS